MKTLRLYKASSAIYSDYYSCYFCKCVHKKKYSDDFFPDIDVSKLCDKKFYYYVCNDCFNKEQIPFEDFIRSPNNHYYLFICPTQEDTPKTLKYNNNHSYYHL